MKIRGQGPDQPKVEIGWKERPGWKPGEKPGVNSAGWKSWGGLSKHEECGDIRGVRKARQEEGEGKGPARQLSGTSLKRPSCSGTLIMYQATSLKRPRSSGTFYHLTRKESLSYSSALSVFRMDMERLADKFIFWAMFKCNYTDGCWQKHEQKRRKNYVKLISKGANIWQ